MALYLEYDHPMAVYRPRHGDRFTSFRGHSEFSTLAEADAVLADYGHRVGCRTDSRTWEIVRERQQ